MYRAQHSIAIHSPNSQPWQNDDDDDANDDDDNERSNETHGVPIISSARSHFYLFIKVMHSKVYEIHTNNLLYIFFLLLSCQTRFVSWSQSQWQSFKLLSTPKPNRMDGNVVVPITTTTTTSTKYEFECGMSSHGVYFGNRITVSTLGWLATSLITERHRPNASFDDSSRSCVETKLSIESTRNRKAKKWRKRKWKKKKTKKNEANLELKYIFSIPKWLCGMEKKTRINYWCRSAAEHRARSTHIQKQLRRARAREGNR